MKICAILLLLLIAVLDVVNGQQEGGASAPDGGCLVCGTGNVVSSPNAVFAFPGQPAVSCDVLQQAGLDGAIPLDQCMFLPGLITACDCEEGDLPDTTNNNGDVAVAPPGGCLVCGDGEVVTSPNAIFQIPGQPAVPCGLLETAGLNGAIPIEQCSLLVTLLGNCNCRPGSLPLGTTTNPPTLSPITNLPTSSPVIPPTSAPVVPPTSAPVVPPTSAPVVPPTSSPVVPPTSSPVIPPTSSPVKSPLSLAPVIPPTSSAPVTISTTAPVIDPPTSSAPIQLQTMVPIQLSTYSPVITDTLSQLVPLEGDDDDDNDNNMNNNNNPGKEGDDDDNDTYSINTGKDGDDDDNHNDDTTYAAKNFKKGLKKGKKGKREN